MSSTSRRPVEPGVGASPTPDYDRVARWFAPLERLCFGGAMQAARTAFDGEVRGARRILVLGPGDGRALPPLLAAAPDAELVAVEPSARMRALAHTRLDAVQARRVDWRTDDWRTLTRRDAPPGGRPFDLVRSDFFLDQFTGAELLELVARTARHLAPGGLWAVADFRPPPRGARGLPARAALRGLYAAFGLTTGLAARRLDDPGPALRAAGLARLARREFRGGWIGAELWRAPGGPAVGAVDGAADAARRADA